MSSLMMMGVGGGPKSGAGAYAGSAYVFDGTNDYFGNTSITYTGTKMATIAGWLYVPSTWPTSGRIVFLANAAGTNRLLLAQAASGSLNISAYRADGTEIVRRQLNTSVLAVDTWYWIGISFDTATSTVLFYVNDTKITSFAATVTIADAIVDGGGRAGFGAQAGGTVKGKFNAFDWYVNTEEFIDFDVEANRRKFIDASGNPVDLGSNGSTPTGLQPELYFSRSWTDNLGSIGTMTLNGTLDVAGSSPTD